MDKLSDIALLKIFKELNLNDRASIRSMCKRFRNLIDGIVIKKLVIFRKLPPVSGKLEYVNIPFELKDTANVIDLQKFFDNFGLMKQMAKIRYLKIIGADNIEIDNCYHKMDNIGQSLVKFHEFRYHYELRYPFNELEYLSINRTNFKESKILTSPKLKYLIINNSLLNDQFDYQSIVHQFSYPEEVFLNDFQNLETNQLEYLNLDLVLSFNRDVFGYLIQQNHFNKIKHLSYIVPNLKSIPFLNDSCPSLKRIDLVIGPDIKNCYQMARLLFNLEDYATELRDDLSVYIFGILYNETTVDFIDRFMLNFSNFMKLKGTNIKLTINKITSKLLKQYDDRKLNQFYKLVNSIEICDQIYDIDLLKKFKNCTEIDFVFNDKPIPNFNMVTHLSKYFQLMSNIDRLSLSLSTTYCRDLNNDVINLISNQQQLFTLSIDSFNVIDFELLFKLKRLTFLQLNLYYPITKIEFLNLVKELKYLNRIDIRFARNKEHTRELLTDFKENVIRYYEDKLKHKNFIFKISIYKNDEIEFIRLFFRNYANYKSDDELKNSESDKLFKIIKYQNNL